MGTSGNGKFLIQFQEDALIVTTTSKKRMNANDNFASI